MTFEEYQEAKAQYNRTKRAGSPPFEGMYGPPPARPAPTGESILDEIAGDPPAASPQTGTSPTTAGTNTSAGAPSSSAAVDATAAALEAALRAEYEAANQLAAAVHVARQATAKYEEMEVWRKDASPEGRAVQVFFEKRGACG